MDLLSAFLCCGSICLAGQILYDHSKLTAGHITSLFVIIGAALDLFHIYDWLLKYCHYIALKLFRRQIYSMVLIDNNNINICL